MYSNAALAIPKSSVDVGGEGDAARWRAEHAVVRRRSHERRRSARCRPSDRSRRAARLPRSVNRNRDAAPRRREANRPPVAVRARRDRFGADVAQRSPCASPLPAQRDARFPRAGGSRSDRRSLGCARRCTPAARCRATSGDNRLRDRAARRGSAHRIAGARRANARHRAGREAATARRCADHRSRRSATNGARTRAGTRRLSSTRRRRAIGTSDAFPVSTAVTSVYSIDG